MATPYEGFVIPSNPSEQLRLAQMFAELTNSMTRTKAEAEHRKSVIATIKEQFDLPGSAISSVAKIMFNENLDEVRAKHEDITQLADVVTNARRKSRVGTVNATSAHDDDSEE